MVGTRYSRNLFPGFSDQTTYTFTVPRNILDRNDTSDVPARPASTRSQTATATLDIAVRLRYRKLNQALMNALFGDDPELTTAPITDLSSDQTTVQIHTPR